MGSQNTTFATHLHSEPNHKVDPLAERMHTMATRLDGIQDEIDGTVAIRPPKNESVRKEGQHGIVVAITDMDDKETGAEYFASQFSHQILTGDDYCWERLTHQASHSARRAQLLTGWTVGLKATMSAVGALGTILATYNLQLWVPVTGQ